LDLLKQIAINTAPGPDYEEDSDSVQAPAAPLVRLIAFYLPQFHSIPENDLWWGTGFTEWTNVTKAVPRFAGHYQPRLPGALGFYDATNPDVLRRQAAMAKKYGIQGFCFHHYWFQGQRILQKPLETLLANPDIDLPFCVNWANESWTRRWDGRERTALIQQEHSIEDSLAFARSLEPMFRDKRYIKIDGRPLLLVYRPALFPEMKKIVALWRALFSSAGFGNPYIAMVQKHGDGNPFLYDMDAAVGFPPFYASAGLPVRKDLDLFDAQYHGLVRNYQTLADATINAYRDEIRTFPGVTPSWDNEARLTGHGTCFSGSTPAAYGHWLRAACAVAMQKFAGDERLVFINAWNEWAEGAYLEPDRHFGYAYLAETRRALNAISQDAENAAIVPDSGQWTARPTHRPRSRRIARQVLNYFANHVEELAWKLRGR
jgi:lipopolysaccharide biosynthesis protein